MNKTSFLPRMIKAEFKKKYIDRNQENIVKTASCNNSKILIA